MFSLKQKQLIDRSFGKLLCYVLSPIVRLTGLVLHLDHTLDKNTIRTIVVAKYFGMGSIIHATGLLRELKKTYPEAHIIFLTRKANSGLMKHIRFIDQTMTIDDTSVWQLMRSVTGIVLSLWKCRVDLFFDLEVYSCFSALMSLLTLARNRIGFFAGRPSDYKSFLYNHLVYMNSNMPVRTCYMLLGKTAGIPLDASSDLDELELSNPEIAERMENIWRKIDPEHYGKTNIAVNVNASELSFARRWDKANFAEVCRTYAEKGFHIYLIGSPGERAYVQEVRDLIPAELPVFNVAGTFPFSEFLVFLRNCDLLLTNDAGLMNVGFILRMKVLSLWGPGLPSQYHIDSNWTKYLKADIYCSPCLYITEMSPCIYHEKPICMTKIKPDAVKQSMDQLLSVREPYRKEDNPYDSCSGPDQLALGVMYDIGLEKQQEACMKKQNQEPVERGRTFIQQIFDRCSWKTVGISFFFSVLPSLFILDFLLKKNWIPSIPVQMLSCYAYAWDPIAIANRLFSIGCTVIAAPLICLGVLLGFTLMAQEQRENMVRFSALSALPVFYQLLLGQFNVKVPVDGSWIAISYLLFSAVFWLHLWRKKNVSGLDFALLFESFFLPLGFVCLAKSICFCTVPEKYPVLCDWCCRNYTYLPYLSFGIVLILLSFPKNDTGRCRRILCAVLQLLMLPLFTWLLPEVYLKQGQLAILYPYGKIFRFIVLPLLLQAVVDILLRTWKPGLLKKAFSPFPLLAILILWKYNHFSLMGLTNFYEFGDRISTYSAIRSGAMTFFKDTTLCYGIWDYLSLRLTEFFSGTLTMADTCGESLMVLFVLTVSFYIFFHLFPVWIAFLVSFFIGGWIPALPAALIAVWIQPFFLKRRALWCIFWSVTASGMFFFRIPQGAMLVTAFLPLFLYQFFCCFKEDKAVGKRLLIFEIIWAVLFFAWPFSPYFYGMLRIIYETGSINSAWAASAWECGSGAVLAFLAANAILFLPVITVLIAGIFRFADIPMEQGRKKAFAWGIFSSSVCYTFVSLSYSFSRIDDLFSRQYQTFVCLLPLLLVPAFQLPDKSEKMKNLLVILAIAPLLALPVVRQLKAPVSPMNPVQKIPVISENTMVDGKSFNLPKAGYGFASSGCREELQAERELKAVLDQVLAPEETFLNLSLYGGLYFLFDRQQPARHTNYYTVTGDLTQFHMLKQLHEKNVAVTVFGRDLYDLSYPMLRTHYLFRYAVKDSFPLKVNNRYFIMMPAQYFQKIHRPVPTLKESMTVWDDFYNSSKETVFHFNNLIYTAAVWGRNAEKLLQDSTVAKMKLPMPQGNVRNQQLRFPEPLAGDQWGILEIDSANECWAGIAWSNEFQESGEICFKLVPGKNLVPLDVYPHWLLAMKNRKMRFFSQDNELKITAVTIYQRRLPAEINQKNRDE